MFVVYWLEADQDGPQPCFQSFGPEEMSSALKFMEDLRIQQHSGSGNIGFITMCSENPNSVGRAGAADPDADYSWTKRRSNMPRAKRELQGDDYNDY